MSSELRPSGRELNHGLEGVIEKNYGILLTYTHDPHPIFFLSPPPLGPILG